MNKLIKIFLIIFSFFLFFGITFAEINLSVSPIKYEINANTGQIIRKSAILFNKSNKSFIIHTGKSDFEAKDGTGNPNFIRKNISQGLSSWIYFDTTSFKIGPKEEKEIFFTIKVPENATPGGHYGAIFFKNHNLNNNNSSNQISINVDYGVLLLVKVDGEIIIDAEVEETKITSSGSSGGYGWGNIKPKKDDCPFGDFTRSSYDKKCVDDIFADIFNSKEKLQKKDEISKINKEKINKNDKNDFQVNFNVPFENKGNTHIKPIGKIKLIDENGKQIKSIGKEIIKDENGMVVGEKIVDYIPINDIGGNVLPYSKRIFETNWKGFPYKTHNENGESIIKYNSPQQHYTKENISNQRIFPWERINEKINNKNIKAITEISYEDENGENTSLNSAKEFRVNYKEKYIGLNPYFIFPFILILFFLFIFWFLFFKKEKVKCKKCGKKIEKQMKICPYCGKKNKKKK